LVYFELTQMLQRRRWRWLIALALVLAFSLLSTHNVLEEFRPLNNWDYLVTSLTDVFTSMLILPIVFLLLVIDLVVEDFHAGYAGLTLTRARSRVSWMLAKIAALFGAALLFSVGSLLVCVIGGLVSGMPFESGWSAHSLLPSSVSPFFAVIMILTLYVVTLTAFGTLVLMSTLFSRGTVAPWIVAVALCILSYFTWKFTAYRPIYKWMPTGHMSFLTYFPNRLTEDLMTLNWAFAYNIALFLAALVLGLWRIRVMNLSKSL
jgi:ABC-type transport system involved in multi-copper enzyme maturation permease subunit